MRTRRENAARKGLRILNERKRAKAARLAASGKSAANTKTRPVRKPRGKPPPVPGERFGKLTAIERAEDYIRPNGRGRELRWRFQCDCGASTVQKVSNVRWYHEHGMASCTDCYYQAGGWLGIKAVRDAGGLPWRS